MDSIRRLTSLFGHFPGIGPRQAQRFVQYLLNTSPTVRRELADAIRSLGGSVQNCDSCWRFFSGTQNLCEICLNSRRDDSKLAVVASDADSEALERSGTYTGKYFVLGGTISLASEKTDGLRIKPLLESLQIRIQKGLDEIILAFPANPEGDATAERLRSELTTASPFLTITSLGRGLSTGSELEYADPDTLKSALESRR